MATVIHLDTHVVIWLYLRDLQRLGLVRHRLEGSRLVISPMVALELQYLFEVGKATVGAEPVLQDLAQRIGLTQCSRPFAQIVPIAWTQSWTRDPFDRLIVANALVQGAPLLTCDRLIRENCPTAVWD